MPFNSWVSFTKERERTRTRIKYGIKTQKEQPDALFLSEAYANLGRKDQAFAWLEKAYEQRSGGERPLFVGIDPGFDPLRSDPRFDAILHRAGAPSQPHAGSAQSSPAAN
jgi:hypothetical protein